MMVKVRFMAHITLLNHIIYGSLHLRRFKSVPVEQNPIGEQGAGNMPCLLISYGGQCAVQSQGEYNRVIEKRNPCPCGRKTSSEYAVSCVAC